MDKSPSPGNVETRGTEKAKAGAVGTPRDTHMHTHFRMHIDTYERNTYISLHTKPALPRIALNEDNGHNRT